MDHATKHFEQFMQQREEVGQAYVNGDAGPLAKISTDINPATFFGPAGDYEQGARKVLANNEHAAGQFQKGSRSRFEIFHMAIGGNLAYWVGIQHAEVRMKDKAAPVSMRLRVTEIFRLEEGEWKLMHRHADALKPADKE
ncbi:MAG: nuclear transport factor 2 family protein [Collimonas sp.]|uniref:YybH family protein n=1 Tax=Collimonas sp. TaxID=1963772 RepID=UPI003266D1C2